MRFISSSPQIPHISSGLKFRATVKWICLLVGSFGGIAATVLHFKQLKNQQNDGVTKIPPTTNVGVTNDDEIDTDGNNDLESGGTASPTQPSAMGGRINANEKRPESRY